MNNLNVKVYTKVFDENIYQHAINIKSDEIKDVTFDLYNIESTIIECVDK